MPWARDAFDSYPALRPELQAPTGRTNPNGPRLARRTISHMICGACGHRYTIRARRRQIVEELRAQGCPKCDRLTVDIY